MWVALIDGIKRSFSRVILQNEDNASLRHHRLSKKNPSIRYELSLFELLVNGVPYTSLKHCRRFPLFFVALQNSMV